MLLPRVAFYDQSLAHGPARLYLLLRRARHIVHVVADAAAPRIAAPCCTLGGEVGAWRKWHFWGWCRLPKPFPGGAQADASNRQDDGCLHGKGTAMCAVCPRYDVAMGCRCIKEFTLPDFVFFLAGAASASIVAPPAAAPGMLEGCLVDH